MLTFYQTQVERLLHDPNNQYFSQSELTDYINEARNRVAQDSLCLRQLITGLTLTEGTELYVPQTFLPAPFNTQVVAVLGITYYYGTIRIKLGYAPFTVLDAQYRRYQNYQSRPKLFTRVGAMQIYVSPNPDQNYVSDWEVSVIPNALVTDSTVEQLPVPFQEPVQYYAAYKAKWKEQAIGEANIFLQQYVSTLRWNARAFQPFIIPDGYRVNA